MASNTDVVKKTIGPTITCLNFSAPKLAKC